MLTARSVDAFRYALEKQGTQVRKGTQIPYLSHLLAVASLVLEDGGTEDEAIAGLLHDAVEDAPEDVDPRDRLEDIRVRFGDRVAAIVEGCTDGFERPKPDWKSRKNRYLNHLPSETNAWVLRVSLSDKLHNARSILADCRELGDEIFDRFQVGKEDQLWYYEQILRAFRQVEQQGTFASRMIDELDMVVTTLLRLCRQPRAG